jgi:hypothetical protein
MYITQRAKIRATKGMIRTTFTAAAIAISALVAPAHADTADVWCFTQETGKAATELKQCGFSQRQGNVRVYRDNIDYFFASEQEGKSYERTADGGGLIFKSPKGLLRVFWQRPCSEENSCAGGI